VTSATTGRIDNFTDAAFAFAVTLLVVGAGGSAEDSATLEKAVAAVPSFAIGFAIIALFWFSHVRWRKLRGDGDWRSLLLTLLLIFTVLIYIVPLRAMATSFAALLMGELGGYRGNIGTLFTVYGVGFTAMSILTAFMFLDARRNPALSDDERRETLGQAWIWGILSATGVGSTLMAMTPGLHGWAPFLYATLPLSIGLFSRRYHWGSGKAAPPLAPDDVEAAGDDHRRADKGPAAG
jgi:uncharacterized membrane protein